MARIGRSSVKACSVCGEPCRTTQVIDTDCGHRWVDCAATTCSPYRGRHLPCRPPWEGILADLRGVLAELGSAPRLRVYTDRRAGVMSPVDDQQRYHLTLTAGGRIVLQGWWAAEAIARRKFSGWVGEYGNLHGARITLVD
jgi:hypothetical protein